MKQGLMQPPTQPMAEGQTPAPQAQVGSGGYLEGGEASPQEQKQYDSLMETFFGMLHSKETRDATVERLKQGADDMGMTIGNMALTLFTSVEDQLTKNGRQIGDSVKLEVGQDLILELVQIAGAAKLLPDDEDAIGQVTADAIDVMASRYGKTQRRDGKYDPLYGEKHMRELMQVANQEFPISELAAGVREAGLDPRMARKGAKPQPQGGPPA